MSILCVWSADLSNTNLKFYIHPNIFKMSSYSEGTNSSYNDGHRYGGDNYPNEECSIGSYSSGSSQHTGSNENSPYDLQAASQPLLNSIPVKINSNVNCPCNNYDINSNNGESNLEPAGDDPSNSAGDNTFDRYGAADATCSCSCADDCRKEDSRHNTASNLRSNGDVGDVISDSHEDDSRDKDGQDEKKEPMHVHCPPEIASPTNNDGTIAQIYYTWEINSISNLI